MYRFATVNKAHTTNSRNELYYKFNDNNNFYLYYYINHIQSVVQSNVLGFCFNFSEVKYSK